MRGRGSFVGSRLSGGASAMTRPRLAAIALAALVLGCKGSVTRRPEPHRFASQAEAGTGHVAVLMVAPWSEYVAELQPKFVITPKEAVDRAGPTTAVMERKLLDMLKVVAKVATPTSGTSITRKSISNTKT